MPLLKAKWAATIAVVQRYGYPFALFLAALVTTPTLVTAVRYWRSQYGQPPSWLTTDIDTGLIHDGLIHAPRFVDTLQWWVGPWAGEVPFYRPLTSYVFWFEWKLFGDREWWYGPPAFAAHLLATVLAAAVAYRLAERWRVVWPAAVAIVTAIIFTGLTRPYRDGLVFGVAAVWKNQPDSLAAVCCFLAILAYLRAQSGTRAWPGGAAAWYGAACCFKEIAFPLPLICLALELGWDCATERWRQVTRVGSMGATGLLLLLIRQYALGGTGYTYGSNAAWVKRSLLEWVGPFAPLVESDYWPGCVAALVIIGVVVVSWGSRTLWRRYQYGAVGAAVVTLLLLVAGVAATGILFQRFDDPERWYAEDWALRFAVALLMVQTPTYAASALGVLFLAATIAVLWKRWRPVLWFAPAWSLFFLAPLVMSPGPSHRYYLPQFGYILLDAIGGCVLLSVASSAVASWWKSVRRGETSGKSASSAIQ